MTTFEQHLARVSGTIRRMDLADRFATCRETSLTYWNKASDLRAGALVLKAACTTKFPITPDDLGLGEGFSLAIALPSAFDLLAGLSLELELKATARLFEVPHIKTKTHSLNELRDVVGIAVSDDQVVTLDALSASVIWKAKYPTPKTREAWEEADRISIKLRGKGPTLADWHNPERAISLRTYEALWLTFAEHYWRAKEVVLEGG